MPFRSFHYWYIAPSNLQAAEKKAAKLKAYFIAKNSPLQYRVYRSGYGSMDNYFLVAFAAADAESYHKTSKETRALLVEEFKKLIDEFRALALRYEEVKGGIREDLSYRPKTKIGAEIK